MNREIKFRAWNKIAGEMEYDCGFERLGGFHQAVNHPIMEYTGLQDKEGKEIYEGDIAEQTISTVMGEEVGDIKIIFEWGKHGFIKRVLDSRGGIGFIPDGAEEDLAEASASEVSRNCEVVGNKFENPELLEEDN